MTKEFAIYCDGSPGGAGSEEGGVAAVVVNVNGEIVVEGARGIGSATSNRAEYKALLYAICLANLVGARQPHFCCDSMLVVQQVSRFWAIKDPELTKLHAIVASELMNFDGWSIQHFPRAQNARADWLVSKLLGHSRTLKQAPTNLEFRTGQQRAGWAGAVT